MATHFFINYEEVNQEALTTSKTKNQEKEIKEIRKPSTEEWNKMTPAQRKLHEIRLKAVSENNENIRKIYSLLLLLVD
jgi:hypothetical protein